MNPSKYRPTATPDLPDRQWPNQRLTRAPIWASVDLRDGNQALATPMSVDQKLQLWQVLVDMGFKTIEIGFPSASQPEFEFTRRLIDDGLIPDDVNVQVLVQAREHLIQKTFEALRGVKRAVVHVYNTTSTVQRERVFEKSQQEILDMAVQGAEWVKHYGALYPDTDWTFQYSPESFSQTETDYALEVCTAVMAVWQPTPEQRCILNLPATVESTSPNRFADQIEYFIRHLPNRESAIISVHTHNDRGCAVAAAELAILAGADRVEGTLLGNGERTGNMDIVTLAMNLYSEGIDPELDLSRPDDWVPVLEDVTKIPTHLRHPWVGEAVYTAYSGSHQDAIRKCLLHQQLDEPWQVAYLPIDPQDLGRDYEAIIRVNSQSGKAGAAFLLTQHYGLNLPKWVQQDFAPVAQQLAESGGGVVSHAQLHQAFERHYQLVPSEPINERLDYQIEREATSDSLRVRWKGRDFKGQGEGTLSALCEAWQATTGQAIDIIDYHEHALHSTDSPLAGKRAQAIAYVYVQVNQENRIGIATAEDTVSAMIAATLKAVDASTD
ncbi:2-isopropylmalate synthase [Thiomicrospira sp. WB1]|nr:2-isopropylmalate synthase [Thiomicrospira sp. WB1]